MGAEETNSEGAWVSEVVGEASRVVQEIPVSGYPKIGRGSADFKADLLIPDECTSASRQHARGAWPPRNVWNVPESIDRSLSRRA